MNIYSSTKVLPYVYICQEKDSPYFYIGYRYKNFLPSSSDFGIHYFTSNTYVIEHFKNFEFTILAEFFTQRDALAFESLLIKETRSKYQINSHRIKKYRGREYAPQVEFINEPKVCALPGCDKIHNNWRSKCCCPRHQKIYAALRRHNKATASI